MSVLRDLILATATLAFVTSAMPQRQRPRPQIAIAGPIANTQDRCEIPIDNCTPYDGELGCEFCCVDFEPAPGSVCHLDLEYSGWCDPVEDGGIIFHCGTHGP